MNNFIQFELWRDCKIGCKFCCNKGQPKINKVLSLNFVLNKLNNIDDYDTIGFIGGEFFNGEIDDVKGLFYKLFNKLVDTNIKKIFVATSLIYDIQKSLIPFLDYLKTIHLLDKICICTSYDIKYRFKSEELRQLWISNMDYLYNYPVELHVETIMSQFFIDSVMNNEFNITEFCNRFHTKLDYIEPCSGLYYNNKLECSKDISDFFPTKKSFIKFLRKVYDVIDKDTFLSMNIRSNTLYYIDNGRYVCQDNRRTTGGKCELNDKTKKVETGFIDSNKNMRKVAEEFFSCYRGENV